MVPVDIVYIGRSIREGKDLRSIDQTNGWDRAHVIGKKSKGNVWG